MNQRFLSAFLVAFFAPFCAAQSGGYTIDLISPAKGHLLVDDTWQQNADCLKVKVSVKADVNAPEFKTYFYDSDGMLIHTELKPSRQTDSRGSMIRAQEMFEKGKKHELFFGIPVAASKWKRAIVVFGKDGDFTARIYPADDL